MRRRQALLLGGTLGLTAIAGCLDALNEESDSAHATPPTERTPVDDEPDSSDDPTPTPDEADAEPEQEHELAQFDIETVDFLDDYPDYQFDEDHPSNVVRLVPYEFVDPDEVDIFLAPSTEHISRDESIEFTLENGMDRTFEAGFYHWQLHKQVDGEWFDVKLSPSLDMLHTLDSGESHTWTLATDMTEVLDMDEKVSARTVAASAGQFDSDLPVPGLGGGQYAFGIRGWFEDERNDEQTAFTTTFELDAPSLELEPTDVIADVTWDEETLLASTDPPEERKCDQPVLVTLEQVEGDASNARHLIPEQVWRYPPLWDALAVAEEYDAESVRFEEYDSRRHTPAVSEMDPDDSTLDGRYEYDGKLYEISVTLEGRSSG